MKSLKYALTVAYVATLISCAPNRSNGNKLDNENNNGLSGQSASRYDGSNASLGAVDGTTDTGGGNVIKNQVLESFARDFTTEPMFLDFMKKMTVAGNADLFFIKNLKNIMESKKWFVTPEPLKVIPNSTLGITFLKNSTTQGAIQAESEIWIDQTIFDKMTSTDKMDLILHEAVMTLFLMQFKAKEDVCKTPSFYGMKDKWECLEAFSFLESQNSPQPYRKLSAKDYSSIRAVTATLLTFKRIEEWELQDLLYVNNFDRRIFTSIPIDQMPASIELTSEEYLSDLSHALTLNPKSILCIGVKTRKSTLCELQITTSEIKEFAGKKTIISWTLTLNGKKIKFDSATASKELLGFTEDQERYIYNDGFESYSLDSIFIKQGQVLYSGIIIWSRPKKDKNLALRIEAIYMAPHKVNEVGSFKKPCRLSKIEPVSLETDSILITFGTNLGLKKLKGLIPLYSPELWCTTPSQIDPESINKP